MLILAIETSNPTAHEGAASVALGTLSERGVLEVLAEEPLRPRSPHHDDLMGAIDRAFAAAQRKPADLTRIAISIGPGGYTSLRIAVATAKMLAEATGARPLPISSHEVAANTSAARGRFAVALASKNGWASVRTFERDDRGVLTLGPPARLMGEPDVSALGVTTLVSDPFLPDSIRSRATALNIHLEAIRLSAAAVLRLAPGRDPIDPLLLTPDYAREAEAVTKWRQMKGR